jgi:Domain of unknown function (DUF6430)
VKSFLEFAQKTSFHTIVFLAGLLLVFVSVFHVDNLGKWQVTASPTVTYSAYIIGVVLILFALAAFTRTLYLSSEANAYSKTGARISSGNDRVVANLGNSTITVTLGRLEQAITDPSRTLVVLPANEYFNDHCINDSRSALGAFVQAKFSGRTREFESLVSAALRGLPSNKVIVGADTWDSYGVGTTIYLDRPLKEGHRILLAAATTERPGEGLRGSIPALFTIVEAANRVAKERRIPEIVLPIIGAGHGSICAEHALIVQFLAWSALIYANPGQKLAIRIVVFRSNPASESAVNLKSIASLLRTATSSCAPRPSE